MSDDDRSKKIIRLGHMGMIAGIAAASMAGLLLPPVTRGERRYSPRLQRAGADRSKKQFLIKGVRP